MPEIRSDRGTNIVGTEKELKKALDEMDHSIIQQSLQRTQGRLDRSMETEPACSITHGWHMGEANSFSSFHFVCPVMGT